MFNPRWTSKIIGRYWLRVAPMQVLILLLALGLWAMGLPWWVEAGIVVGWLAKDVAMFPFLWWMVDDNHLPEHTMIGRVGRVIEPVQADRVEGIVRIRGELWRARCEECQDGTLPVGTRVQVVEVQGLTVIVIAKRAYV